MILSIKLYGKLKMKHSVHLEMIDHQANVQGASLCMTLKLTYSVKTLNRSLMLLA